MYKRQVWRFSHASKAEAVRGYDFALFGGSCERAQDPAVGVRDMPTARRSAGLAYAAMHDAPTMSEVAMRARLAVWRFIDASKDTDHRIESASSYRLDSFRTRRFFRIRASTGSQQRIAAT